MKKILNITSIFAAAAIALSSCSEWDPVVNIGYDEPLTDIVEGMKANTTIAAVKALYKGKPVRPERKHLSLFLYPGRNRSNRDKDRQRFRL